jgi:hypothetical protein
MAMCTPSRPPAVSATRHVRTHKGVQRVNPQSYKLCTAVDAPSALLCRRQKHQLCLRPLIKVIQLTQQDLRSYTSQGRTTVRTTDATGAEETRETLHGLSKSEAQGFDAEWAARGGPSIAGVCWFVSQAPQQPGHHRSLLCCNVWCGTGCGSLRGDVCKQLAVVSCQRVFVWQYLRSGEAGSPGFIATRLGKPQQ